MGGEKELRGIGSVLPLNSLGGGAKGQKTQEPPLRYCKAKFSGFDALIMHVLEWNIHLQHLKTAAKFKVAHFP